jgi:hypothetical protein
MECKRHAFNTCHAKKNWHMILTPHNATMVHPTSMCLPWTKNMLWNPHVNVVPKHKTTQQKIKNQCTTYHNARSSCGASFTMKHDGFQFDICEKSFAHKALNHSTKSSHVCQLVITQATSTPMQWKSNVINVNKWYFTSLLPNVASIKISLLWLNWNMAWNVGVWIPMVKGTWISFTYLHTRNKKTSSRWAQTHDSMESVKFVCKRQVPLLCFWSNRQYLGVIGNHSRSPTHPYSRVPTKFLCVCHKFASRCTLTLIRSI